MADDEIEVTPEMIERGVVTLLDNPRFYESEETIVERVFRAMAAVKKAAS